MWKPIYFSAILTKSSLIFVYMKVWDSKSRNANYTDYKEKNYKKSLV